MELTYPHDLMHVNNREVPLTKILSGEVTPLSDFESEVFSFITKWLQGIESIKLHTSGSTGTPKEITLTRNQLQQSAQRTIKALDLNQNDTAFICLDTKYIAGKMMLVRALENNMKIVAVEPSSNPFKNLTARDELDFAAFVPLQLQTIMNKSELHEVLNRMKVILVGGAPVNASLQDALKKLNCSVFATYGMTETVSNIALQKLNGSDLSDCFKTLPGISVEKDERGCLVINVPEIPQSIVTNDLVEVLNPTAFRWLGRWDTIINSGGIKVSPEKIENEISPIFKRLNINSPYFITSMQDSRLGEKIVLFIEFKLPPLTLNKLREELLSQTTSHTMPKEIIPFGNFQYTKSGKIDRKRTLEVYFLNG